MKKETRTSSVADFMQAMHKPWSVVAKKRNLERDKTKKPKANGNK